MVREGSFLPPLSLPLPIIYSLAPPGYIHSTPLRGRDNGAHYSSAGRQFLSADGSWDAVGDCSLTHTCPQNPPSKVCSPPSPGSIQIPDALWDGCLPREGVGPEGSWSVVSLLGRDHSPREGRQVSGEQRTTAAAAAPENLQRCQSYRIT